MKLNFRFSIKVSCIALGTALTVISKDLSISPKSVSTYRSRILEKIRCRNNAEITQYAMREGLI